MHSIRTTKRRGCLISQELVDQVRVAFSYLVANGAPLGLALWAGPSFAPTPKRNFRGQAVPVAAYIGIYAARRGGDGRGWNRAGRGPRTLPPIVIQFRFPISAPLPKRALSSS